MAYYNGNKIISNGRADFSSPYYEFAKSEYEKTLNLFNEQGAYNVGVHNLIKSEDEFYCNSNVFCIGASADSIGRYVINIPKNTPKIYFKFKAKSSDLDIRLKELYLCTVDYDGKSKNYWCGISKNATNDYVEYSGSVTLGTNVCKIGFVLYSTNTNNSTLYVKDFMISLNDIDFKAYNGSILHPIDIEPVLLWRNGNPNNEFVGKEYDTLDRTSYKRFLLGYYITPGSAIKYIEINNSANSGGALTDLWAYENGATIYNLIRKVSLTLSNPTKITFGDCYQGTSVVNNRMIPAVLYGLNY